MLTVGDHNRQAYVVVRLSDNDLYTEEFEDRTAALACIDAVEEKCYLIAVEYTGGGTYSIDCVPYT